MQGSNWAESWTGSHPRSGNMVEAWLGLENSNEANNINVFVCPICSKAFGSIQALGGHQNAHRKERADEMAAYIRHRLETSATINIIGDAPNPGKNVNLINVNTGFDDQVGEPSSKRAKKAEVDEDLSLDLTLRVCGGGAARESGHMQYNYPDVLFPASEFMDLNVDLDLKL